MSSIVYIRLAQADGERLRQLARVREVSISEVAREAIRAYLARTEAEWRSAGGDTGSASSSTSVGG